jgi:hypothetical protein
MCFDWFILLDFYQVGAPPDVLTKLTAVPAAQQQLDAADGHPRRRHEPRRDDDVPDHQLDQFMVST